MSWYPRVLYDGHGEISDVCLKRKIRNRLQDMGEEIFVQEDSRIDDGYRSLKERILNFDDFKNEYRNKKPDFKKMYDSTCKKWIDVRAFGQIFPFKGGGNNSSTNVVLPWSTWAIIAILRTSSRFVFITNLPFLYLLLSATTLVYHIF